MKKLIPAITLIALIGFQAQVQAAWPSKKKAAEEAEQANTPGFDIKDRRSAYIEVDYLLWRPQMEDTAFALKNKGSSQLSQEFSLKQPSYDLSSGVRVGIGGYTSDCWDIGLRAMYLFADATKHVSGDSTENTKVFPQWTPSLFGNNGDKATANWRLNFYVADFTIGREYFLLERFAIHPFIGLRGFQLSQKLKNKFRGTFTSGTTPNTTDVVLPGKFKAEQSIWGIGPRLGLDLKFYFVNTWAFLGGLSGSLLYSRYHINQHSVGNLDSVVTDNDLISTFTINAVTAKTKDKDAFGRANLDAYFGIGWDQWFNKGENRVAISLLFEASHWFQLNQWVDMDMRSLNDSTNQATKRHGDLSFIGGTLHFQLDF